MDCSPDYKKLLKIGDKVKVVHPALKDFYPIKNILGTTKQIIVPENYDAACCRVDGKRIIYCVLDSDILEIKGYFSDR